jgi:hypothetical protein
MEEEDMKTNLLLASLIVVTSLVAQGCATVGKGGSSAPVATLESVVDDYDFAQMQAQATQDALTELIVSPNADLQQAYRSFDENVGRMLEAGDKLAQHADAMHFRGPAYIVESEQSATACLYPRQEVPTDRRVAELGVYFNAIADEGWEVKRAYRDYQFDLTQIRCYLSASLNPARLDAMTPLLRKASHDGDSLQDALDTALDAMSRAKIAKAQTPAGS